MCLVIYSESLPSRIHDEVMETLESPMGQDAKELADALFRQILSDGTNCLTAVHKAGYMKKVPTNQVIVTPSAASSCRLDELNNILKQMEQGEDAIKKLAELDKGQSLGIDGSRDLSANNEIGLNNINDNTVLSDADLIKQRISQANTMRSQAQGLIAEAKRLEQEAKSLAPKRPNAVKSTTKKVTT